MNNTNEIDLTGDGVVSEKELELYERRANHRRRMAWVSLIAMVLSAFALMFFVPDERLTRIVLDCTRWCGRCLCWHKFLD
jgi:hypothetical protein